MHRQSSGALARPEKAFRSLAPNVDRRPTPHGGNCQTQHVARSRDRYDHVSNPANFFNLTDACAYIYGHLGGSIRQDRPGVKLNSHAKVNNLLVGWDSPNQEVGAPENSRFRDVRHRPRAEFFQERKRPGTTWRVDCDSDGSAGVYGCKRLPHSSKSLIIKLMM